jgi:hypothetical protein
MRWLLRLPFNCPSVVKVLARITIANILSANVKFYMDNISSVISLWSVSMINSIKEFTMKQSVHLSTTIQTISKIRIEIESISSDNEFLNLSACFWIFLSKDRRLCIFSGNVFSLGESLRMICFHWWLSINSNYIQISKWRKLWIFWKKR